MRDITHLWYSSWPATGVPEDGKTIVSLLMEARKGQSKEHKSPMVVHCSPGTGRTGAVLAILSVCDILILAEVLISLDLSIASDRIGPAVYKLESSTLSFTR